MDKHTDKEPDRALRQINEDMRKVETPEEVLLRLDPPLYYRIEALKESADELKRSADRAMQTIRIERCLYYSGCKDYLRACRRVVRCLDNSTIRSIGYWVVAVRESEPQWFTEKMPSDHEWPFAPKSGDYWPCKECGGLAEYQEPYYAEADTDVDSFPGGWHCHACQKDFLEDG
jgi:hypothetical protein